MALTTRDWPRSVLTAATIVSFAGVCAVLYWARDFLIPLALGALFTFILSPLVTRLQRRGVPRVVAVVAVVVLTGLSLASIGWVVYAQVSHLASDLPRYEENIQQKLEDLEALTKGGLIERVQQSWDRVRRRLAQARPEETTEAGLPPPTEDEVDAEAAVPVKTVPADEGPMDVWTSPIVSGLLQGLGTAGLVVVLVVFMLMKREDLRNRVVSIAGQSSLAVTTRALDDAGKRISRYLLMQFIINGTYGLAVGVGLAIIGIPYSALWGLCAAVLRYIPYLGPWIAALLPIAVSLMTARGWVQPLEVVGLFVVLELISNNVMEPWLYGHSVGLSEIAVIVAAIFWTWLWGPVGLVLSTPMTVCLVVLGRYVPALEIFDRLLSERPPLEPYVSLYQRLLARDEDEAEEIVERHLKDHSPERTFDELLLPTLALARRDAMRGHAGDDDERFVLRVIRECVEEIEESRTETEELRAEADPEREARSKILVMGLPSRGEADELTLLMLRQLLAPAHAELEVLSPDMLIAERIQEIADRQPACVCVSSLPPGDLRQTRQICKRLKARCPDIKLLVGRWSGAGNSEKSRELLRSVGVDRVESTLAEMQQALIPVIQFHEHAGVTDAAEPVAAQHA